MKPIDSDNLISNVLESSHGYLNARHGLQRQRLLNALPNTPRIPQEISAKWNYIVGGVGLSAIAMTLLLTLWILGSPRPAVALERAARALANVNSYSFRMESVQISRAKQGRTVRQVTVGSWRTNPVGMHADIRVVETTNTNTPTPGNPTTVVHLEETHRAGQKGILIDHLKKEYWWIDQQLSADTIGNPQILIYMVRERRGRVVRDLGNKQINGQMTRGIELILDDAQPKSELGNLSSQSKPVDQWEWRDAKIEVWIDPKTDLPVEFHCKRGAGDSETSYLHFTDLKWNVEFSGQTTVPQGYQERDMSSGGN